MAMRERNKEMLCPFLWWGGEGRCGVGSQIPRREINSNLHPHTHPHVSAEINVRKKVGGGKVWKRCFGLGGAGEGMSFPFNIFSSAEVRGVSASGERGGGCWLS